MSKTKEYSNGELTVVWQADKCIHSAKCVKGLPEVFNPNERPWIKAEAASTKALAEQVRQCPSAALTYYMNEGHPDPYEEETESLTQVECIKNGPLMVYGELEVTLPNGETMQRKKATAFCRCGATGNKPFCDGSHKKAGFEE